jgi:hypothetical protein
VIGTFFTTKDTNGHEKISWQARHIRAEKVTSMKFFRVLSGISLFKKNFLPTPGSLTPYAVHKKIIEYWKI